jgi:hypothetical protein
MHPSHHPLRSPQSLNSYLEEEEEEEEKEEKDSHSAAAAADCRGLQDSRSARFRKVANQLNAKVPNVYNSYLVIGSRASSSKKSRA